jgi:type IV secretory pathway VirB4 component
MINLRDQASEYISAGATNETIGLHSWLDEQIFLTKDEQLGAVIYCPGIDFEGKDPAELDTLARRFESAIRTFTEDHRIYQYLVKTNAPLLKSSPHPNEVVTQATMSRLNFFQAKADKLFKVDVFFVITMATRPKLAWIDRFKTNPFKTLMASVSSNTCYEVSKTELTNARNALNNSLQNFIIATEDLFQGQLLDKYQAFQFFRRLLNFDPNNFRDAQLPEDDLLDYHACSATIEAWRRHLQHDDYCVEVLTLKQPPATTFANVLAELFTIPSEFVICSEFRRIPNDQAARLIQSKRRHFHNSKTSIVATAMAGDAAHQPGAVLVNSAADALVTELGECQTEIEVCNSYFGEFSLTLVLYNRDAPALASSIAEVKKIFHTRDGDLFCETYNLLNAYLGIIPGNQVYNIRRLYISATNYADLSFIFTIKTGDPVNRHLNAEYLAVFETDHQSLYHLVPLRKV